MNIVPESKRHIEEDIKERSDAAWKYVFAVRNQNYVVMSIVESTSKPCSNSTSESTSESTTSESTKTPAIKIYGVYASLEEANKASREISNANDFFNVYVADTNAWIPIPPTTDFIENVEYQEERLTQIKDAFTALKERNAQNLNQAIKRDSGGKDYVEEVVDVVDM